MCYLFKEHKFKMNANNINMIYRADIPEDDCGKNLCWIADC